MTKNNSLLSLFNDFFNNGIATWENTKSPAVNIRESDDAYIMEIASPGISKESCKIDICDGNMLHVSVESKTENKDEDKKHRYIRREFSYSGYTQDYEIPDDVDADKISAKVKNGVLSITMPKTRKIKQERGKSIEIL